jgi:hypothetical protein
MFSELTSCSAAGSVAESSGCGFLRLARMTSTAMTLMVAAIGRASRAPAKPARMPPARVLRMTAAGDVDRALVDAGSEDVVLELLVRDEVQDGGDTPDGSLGEGDEDGRQGTEVGADRWDEVGDAGPQAERHGVVDAQRE